MHKLSIQLGSIFAFAGFVFAAPASSADLDRDCCADLEERVAELEATAARKGNSKISLTVSGWLNEAIFVWDDGTQHGVYEGTNLIEQPRVRFTGEVKIDKVWSAGYSLEIGIEGNPSNQWNQFSDVSQSADPTKKDNATNIKKSNWFINNTDLGQIAVGLNAMATYHLLDDADSTQTRYASDADAVGVYMSAFLIRSGGKFVGATPLKWTDVLRGWKNSTPGQADLRDVVRYDSPTFAGFTASASWGEHYLWDTALTYKNDFGDFHVIARAGYGSSNDPGTTLPGVTASGAATTYVVGGSPCISGASTATSLPDFRCTWEGAAATIQHSPTGLYVYGGWGGQFADTSHPFPAGTAFIHDSSFLIVQPGIEHNWLSLGPTTIFGGYRRDDPGSNPGKTVEASINFWQAGVVQKIEAARAYLYLIYQHADGEVIGDASTAKANAAPSGTTPLNAFQEVIGGMRINF